VSGRPLSNTGPGPIGIVSAHPDRRATFYAAPGRQWWLVIVLLIVSTLATIDRQVIALLVNPIREHLQITDTQISLVIGAGFALSNTLFTLPAGVFADRSSRRALIVAGALVWSFTTMACGAAGSFVQLLVARAGVGFGESVIQPCALSMLSAALSPERRGRGFAVQSMAFMGGSALALIVGGILISHFTMSGLHELPLLGAVRPWQLTLIVVGLVGIPAAGLLFTVREPPRPTHAAVAEGGYFAALVMIRARWKVYVPLFVFQLTMTMLSLSYAAWLAAMIERLWHLSIREIGLSLGLMMLVLPPLGLWTAGQAMDFAAARRGPRGPVLVGLIATALVAVAASAAPLSSSLPLFWVLIGALMLVSGTVFPIAATVTAIITPVASMGRITALQLFLAGLVAAAIGPTAVAMVSDTVFTGPVALAHALSAVCGLYSILSLAALVMLFRAIRPLAP
jgi:MFS transporter, Spinster family, sphingosine-1-phosphate transporter